MHNCEGSALIDRTGESNVRGTDRLERILHGVVFILIAVFLVTGVWQYVLGAYGLIRLLTGIFAVCPGVYSAQVFDEDIKTDPSSRRISSPLDSDAINFHPVKADCFAWGALQIG